MSLEGVSFIISFLSLLVAIAAFAIGKEDEGNKGLRYGLGVLFLLFALVFGLVGAFALVDDNADRTSTGDEVTYPQDYCDDWEKEKPTIIND